MRDEAAFANRSRLVFEVRLPLFADGIRTHTLGLDGGTCTIRVPDILPAHHTVLLPPASLLRETFSPEAVSPNSRVFQDMMGATVSFARLFMGEPYSPGGTIGKFETICSR